MKAGSNSKVDSKPPSKGRPRSKPSSRKWFGMLANRPHRLEKFLFYKEKDSEDTINDEVHSWRRDRCGSPHAQNDALPGWAAQNHLTPLDRFRIRRPDRQVIP